MGKVLSLLEQQKLFFLDARTSLSQVVSGDFDLSGLLSGLAAKAKRMKAKRIVFHSVDVLLSLLNNRAREQSEIQRIIEWLNTNGLTGIVTGKLNDGNSQAAEHYEFLQYVGDCVVVLSRQSTERISQYELNVVKYRGSGFSENTAPMVIGDRGIEVAHVSSEDRTFLVSKERVSSGVHQPRSQ